LGRGPPVPVAKAGAFLEQVKPAVAGHDQHRCMQCSQSGQWCSATFSVCVQAAYNRARKVLTDHLPELHALAGALIEKETLSGEQITELLSNLQKGATVSTTGKGSSNVGGSALAVAGAAAAAMQDVTGASAEASAASSSRGFWGWRDPAATAKAAAAAAAAAAARATGAAGNSGGGSGGNASA
jgi:hypothetical protein